MYKISKRLVTENNKGSNSQLLVGVVTEDYTQKKDNTKETKQTVTIFYKLSKR